MTKLFKSTILCFVLSLLALTALAQAPVPVNEKTPLDKYVEAPDPTYKYELVNKVTIVIAPNNEEAHLSPPPFRDLAIATWR